MHRVAEEGIAAHWCYKERRKFQEEEDQRFAWLRRMVEWQRDYHNPQDFLETVRLELYPEEVFVFTPRGEVKEFPRGATPVDFAYAIHTEVGHTCTGARINGRMVSLKYKLQNGDTVEIITSPNHVPSRDWLQFVRTPRARSKIRQWLKTAERERSITLGKEILEKELRKAGLSLSKLLKAGDKIQKVAQELSFVRIDDLLAAVGYGKISPGQISSKLLPRPELLPPAEELLPPKPGPPSRRRDRGGITVKGVEDIMIHLAQCCNPIPGDPIMGYITRGKGITIHRADCPYLARTESIRHITAEWDGNQSGRHPVRVQVVSLDKPGLLADITAALKTADANVIKANIETTVDEKGICWFTIEVTDTNHLIQVFNSIKRVKDIISVSRVTT
jgi:guanosine-3',5'-bis(diphosphate) 3'-pyrophosphohydrolase